MKKLIFLITGLFMSLALFSQEVISSAGATHSASGYEVSWTLGEPVIETVSSGTNILTQGFHQTNIAITPVNDLLIKDVEISVYPNPTHEFVTIRFSKMVKNPVYSLFDLSGQLLSKNIIESNETLLNMKTFSVGSYLLKLTWQNNRPLQTFKIIKN